MNNAPVINAIPTEYRGTTFRSRTEARWAVFLDELDIQWQYEAEGYQLDSGQYLPDFWLPDIDGFLEVKPSSDEWDDPRFDELARLTGKRVYVTAGAPQRPWDDKSPPEPGMACVFPEGGYDLYFYFCVCDECGKWDIQFDGRSARIDCRCHPGGVDGKDYTGHRANFAAKRAAEFNFWNTPKASRKQGWR